MVNHLLFFSKVSEFCSGRHGPKPTSNLQTQIHCCVAVLWMGSPTWNCKNICVFTQQAMTLHVQFLRPATLWMQVNCQEHQRNPPLEVHHLAIIDGVKEVVETALHDRGRQAEVHNCQISNQNSKSASKTKKPQARPPSPAASDASSVGSSRVSSSGRTLRFEDQSSDPSNGRGYGSSDRGRWTNRQSGSQGNGDHHRPTGNNTRPQPPSSGNADSSFRRGGPRYPPLQSERQWRPGQGGLSYRPPPSGNYKEWRQEWRSSSRDRDDGSSRQQQPPQGERRWSFGSTSSQPPGFVDTPSYRSVKC